VLNQFAINAKLSSEMGLSALFARIPNINSGKVRRNYGAPGGS
jgi:hypothetical protein